MHDTRTHCTVVLKSWLPYGKTSFCPCFRMTQLVLEQVPYDTTSS